MDRELCSNNPRIPGWDSEKRGGREGLREGKGGGGFRLPHMCRDQRMEGWMGEGGGGAGLKGQG